MLELPILSADERKTVRPELRDVVDYRKSGLSLNHIIGCPLDCAYCVRHLFDNFQMRRPTMLMSDQEAVDQLLAHEHFVPHRTPLQLFNRATDPLLPEVKPHTLGIVARLDSAGLTNHLLIISRFRIDPADCAQLNAVRNLRLTLLFTHSGIDDPKIEPFRSSVAAQSIITAVKHADRYRVINYWRPLVPGLNDSDDHLARAAELTSVAHATAFTGLFFRDEIRAYYEAHALPIPFGLTARRKIFPERLEKRILDYFAKTGLMHKLFRKTSCAVSFAHGLPDYNGHYCIREICDICPNQQVARCAAAHALPDIPALHELAATLGATDTPQLTDRAIVVSGLDEQRRYRIQHHFQYQVHDPRYPHRFKQHGRAPIGWQSDD